LKFISADFVCFVCASPDGLYDYREAALRVLSRTSGKQPDRQSQFLRAAEAERIGLTRAPLDISKPLETFKENMRIDEVAQRILTDFRTTVPSARPVATTGDGNCLFNALSIALVGNESMSGRLRLMIGLELVINRQLYEKCYPLHDSPWHGCCGPYVEAMEGTFVYGEWATGWHLHAAATVLQRPVHSIYPPKNGLLATTNVALNRIFYPVLNEDARAAGRDAVMILWSGGQSSQASWKPDHFVPILNVASSECIIEDGNDATDDGHDNVSQQRETPIKRSPPVAYRSPCTLISDDGRIDEVPCSSDSRVRNIREGFLDARETFEF
jgi:hypothetical protein